ncbi:MAG TPA: CheR family methyltransferase [Chthoniobacter sp.]|nr:CheR family methyltransferase [Chthoniobacter sp.]
MELDAGRGLIWQRASERIADTMGLHFPEGRRADLQRGLDRAAGEFGCVDGAALAEWMLATELSAAQLRSLASYLTVGETYFLRERKTFEALAQHVLPPLLAAKRQRERRLRIWSAGCCTGEEAYSISILLQQIIPDLAEWHVSILATDINERFLQKASAGVYGEWSFRDTPPDFKERYFLRQPDGRYAILPEIKQRVHFASLNLVEDVFPSLTTDTNAMDLIFCRNVLMYFTHAQAVKVIANFRRALVDDGWLMVSPTEASQALFPDFKTSNHPGVILYQKAKPQDRPASTWTWSPPEPPPVPWTPPEPIPEALPQMPDTAQPSAQTLATQHYKDGDYAEAIETLLSSATPPGTARDYSLLAHSLANLGRLDQALEWCDRWLASDKLDASAHYLRAVTLQELGRLEDAGLALQRAIYLQPRLILAHFALGNLARNRGRHAEADKHFSNALDLLHSHSADTVLPESDGLTAGRLAEIVTSFLSLETLS